MQNPFALLITALALAATANATSSVNVGAVIPDNDPNGYQSSQNLTGLQNSISHVTVTLNISGGYNGDLYAFLYHNNTMAVLLNRVGRSGSSTYGYRDAGFGPDVSLSSFTLDDLAGQDIHYYRTFPYSLNANGQLTGSWQPDGRALDPESSTAAFGTALRTAPLSLFNYGDPNGLWTLFVSDVSPLGESTLVSWGLDVTTAVPEPASATLLCCSLAGALLWRQTRPGHSRPDRARS